MKTVSKMCCLFTLIKHAFPHNTHLLQMPTGTDKNSKLTLFIFIWKPISLIDSSIVPFLTKLLTYKLSY